MAAPRPACHPAAPTNAHKPSLCVTGDADGPPRARDVRSFGAQHPLSTKGCVLRLDSAKGTRLSSKANAATTLTSGADVFVCAGAPKASRCGAAGSANPPDCSSKPGGAPRCAGDVVLRLSVQ